MWPSDHNAIMTIAYSRGNECGGEAFYNYAATPWFLVSADLQIINPAERAYSTAILFGVRAQIRF